MEEFLLDNEKLLSVGARRLPRPGWAPNAKWTAGSCEGEFRAAARNWGWTARNSMSSPTTGIGFGFCRRLMFGESMADSETADPKADEEELLAAGRP